MLFYLLNKGGVLAQDKRPPYAIRIMMSMRERHKVYVEEISSETEATVTPQLNGRHSKYIDSVDSVKLNNSVRPISCISGFRVWS